jgi:precorrin-8X/cobalt-precorrin-8 methylmutase
LPKPVALKMTEKKYSDLGAVTPEAREIYNKSRSFIAGIVGDRTPEDKIKQRCVIATGDLGVAEILRFKNDPVNAGLAALEKGATIYVDIRMVEAGVVKKGHNSPVITAIGRGDDLAEREGITRTSAGFRKLTDDLSGSIVVIGNAPSALLTVCELIEKGEAKPALVIGVPVGFVNAAESKERLREIAIPSISTEGTRGGTPIAVAAINEIINLRHGKKEL